MSGFSDAPTPTGNDEPAKQEPASDVEQKTPQPNEPKTIIGGFGSTPRLNRRGSSGWG